MVETCDLESSPPSWVADMCCKDFGEVIPGIHVISWLVSALFDAVENQDLDAVKDILETNGIDINRYVLLNLKCRAWCKTIVTCYIK